MKGTGIFMNKRIFLCEDNIDGIFTAVYLAWGSKLGHSNVKLEELDRQNRYSNLELFSEYVTVETDSKLALKVSKAIMDKISRDVYEMVCLAALSDYPGKADLIYRFLVLGFHAGAEITGHLSNETVNTVFKLSNNVSREQHHLLGFVRFSEQESGFLLAAIQPKSNVLSLLAPHFSDRLPQERFVIYDRKRNTAVLHIPGKPWILAGVSKEDADRLREHTSGEHEYADLWKIFVQNIAIMQRLNPNLQRNNLPLHFRKNMTEFMDE